MSVLCEQDCIYLDTYFKQALTEHSDYSEHMNLTKVHGFLSAIISTPTLVKPVDWTPLVLGSELNFESVAQAEKVMDLILDLYRKISCQLRGMEPYQLILWDGTAFKRVETCSEALLQDWCIGYLAGIRLDPLWETDKNAVAMLEPFTLFARRNINYRGAEQPEGCMLQYRRHLCDFIEDNYAYWLNEREEEIRLHNLNQKNKPTCPCGSKLTFDECCCGHLSTLH